MNNPIVAVVRTVQRLVRKDNVLQYIPGLMWERDHIRPLGFDEYQIYMTTSLPFGWSIISCPELIANTLNEHRR